MLGLSEMSLGGDSLSFEHSILTLKNRQVQLMQALSLEKTYHSIYFIDAVRFVSNMSKTPLTSPIFNFINHIPL